MNTPKSLLSSEALFDYMWDMKPFSSPPPLIQSIAAYTADSSVIALCHASSSAKLAALLSSKSVILANIGDFQFSFDIPILMAALASLTHSVN
jgi:hypothetical protein